MGVSHLCLPPCLHGSSSFYFLNWKSKRRMEGKSKCRGEESIEFKHWGVGRAESGTSSGKGPAFGLLSPVSGSCIAKGGRNTFPRVPGLEGMTTSPLTVYLRQKRAFSGSERLHMAFLCLRRPAGGLRKEYPIFVKTRSTCLRLSEVWAAACSLCGPQITSQGNGMVVLSLIL